MRVFLSSTFKDLADIRRQVDDALRVAGRDSSQMEFFAARPESPLEVSLKEVRASDILVLIIGSRYGTLDQDSELSITHLEFRETVRDAIPVLAFKVPGEDSDGQEKADRLRQFVEEVQATPNITCAHIESRDEVPTHVVAALWRYVEEHGDAPRAPSRLAIRLLTGPRTVIAGGTGWQYENSPA